MRDLLLALDFDGVLWDSVGECYFTARRAWAALHGEVPDVAEDAFRRGRWLVRAGGEFGLVVALLLEDPARDLATFPAAEFQRRRRADLEGERRFAAEYYAQREQARQEDPAGWAALQGPYPEVIRELPALREAFREIVICSTKDAASIHHLLETCGQEFPVLGRESSEDKRDQMSHLMQTRGLPAGDIVFVDDFLPNLEPVRPLGVRVALAEWGYNTPDERRAAAERGIPVVRAGHLLEDLRERVLGGA